MINNPMAVPSFNGDGRPFNASSYGFQSVHRWQAGESDVRPVVDSLPHEAGCWRVTVVGDVTVSVEWGSGATRNLTEMDAPLIGTFAGKVTVYAKPRTDQGAEVKCTLAPSFSGELRDFRRLVVGAGAAIDPQFATYRALTASVITIRGTVVNVPALSSVPLVSGSVHTSGTGYLEYTP